MERSSSSRSARFPIRYGDKKVSFDFDVEDQKNTSVFLFSPEGRLLGLVRSRGERSRSRTDKHVTVEDLVISQPAGWRDVSQQRKSSGARSRTPRMKPRTEGLTPPMEFKKKIHSHGDAAPRSCPGSRTLHPRSITTAQSGFGLFITGDVVHLLLDDTH